MIKPLKNYLLLEKPEKEEKTTGGIFMPVKQEEDFKTPQGIILDIGAACDPKFKKGIKVVYNRGYENEVVFQLKDYILVKDEYVMAIIE